MASAAAAAACIESIINFLFFRSAPGSLEQRFGDVPSEKTQQISLLLPRRAVKKKKGEKKRNAVKVESVVVVVCKCIYRPRSLLSLARLEGRLSFEPSAAAATSEKVLLRWYGGMVISRQHPSPSPCPAFANYCYRL